MVTPEEVTARYPQAEAFDQEKLAHWCEVAEAAVPIGRVVNMRDHESAQMLFVMHQMEKPPVDLDSPVNRALVTRRDRRGIPLPDVWGGTAHGEMLKQSVRY